MSKFRLCTMDLAKEAGLSVHRFPISSEETAIAEDALARALNKLSLDEQEKIIFDVHGIATMPHEYEDTANVSLKALEKEIDRISKKDAYNQALFLNPNFVKDPKFQLMFLRALEFNIEAAADMIVKHFDAKHELFGDGEILAREIRQSDLSARDLEIVQHGLFQILPTSDASGRAVICMIVDLHNFRMSEFARPTFYVAMAALRDEELQKTGAVWLAYNMGDSRLDLAEYIACNRIEATLPIRCASGHFCFNSHSLRPLVAGFQLFNNHYDRFRLRSHFGSLESIHFSLQTFGIPTDVSPMKADGSWSTDHHLEWLRAQARQEEAGAGKLQGDAVAEHVIIPRKFDVLFGKSARARLSTGTQRALHLVDIHREQYEKASKYEKTDLAEKIMTAIFKSNGRFLKQTKKCGGWTVVDDVEARQKIAHWFRHMRWKSSQSQQYEGSQQEEVSSWRESSNARDEGEDGDTAVFARPTKRMTPSISPLTTEGE